MVANFTKRNLGINNKSLSKISEKLSSGYRINRAADDAAGLAISEEMRGQIRGLNRGSYNITDGISLADVADGALSEVHSILQRMRELSVQAANDTNADEDRAAIQSEIDCLKKEINRISDQTEFNTIKLFKGGVETVYDSNGDPVDIGDIPFSDFELRDLQLGNTPFNENSSVTELGLKAYISPTRNIPQARWNLIFGNGGTSNLSVRAKYTDSSGSQVTRIIDARSNAMSVVQGSYSYDSATQTYSRSILCDFGEGAECTIKQSVSIGNNDGNEQYYTLSYECTNTGTKAVDIDFMVALDTAYNNNDRCEGYFVNGTRINNACIYTNDSAKYDPSNNNSSYIYPSNGISDGLSIVDQDNSLPFSEKVKWEGSQPDAVSIGHYTYNDSWNDYNSNSSDGIFGGSNNRADLELSLMWNNNHQEVSDTSTFKFKYGIAKVENDPNLSGVPIRRYHGSEVHSENLNLWIQAGANSKQGIPITIGEMDTTVLGIEDISMMSYESANDAIQSMDAAIEKVSLSRTTIGAQTNRLSFAYNNDLNGAENLQASESKLRDANIQENMVAYAAYNILQQAGQSMLAQANRANDGILTLLQR